MIVYLNKRDPVGFQGAKELPLFGVQTGIKRPPVK
jgi:hypothetical protein